MSRTAPPRTTSRRAAPADRQHCGAPAPRARATTAPWHRARRPPALGCFREARAGRWSAQAAILVGKDIRAHAHIAERCCGDLLTQARLIGFPAVATQPGALAKGI